jgi:6,7-dimethyl-8-ribityllumazine synthase
MRICFIEASWHKDVVDKIRHFFIAEISRLEDAHIDVITVPGIYEIPLQAKLAAKRKAHDAIVAAGVIVTGGLYQYEFVAAAVVNSLMQIQLECETPIISALFSPLEAEDGDVEAFLLQHAELKGKESAVACRDIIHLMWRLNSRTAPNNRR